VRFLTPETDAAIGLFRRTHVLTPMMFGGFRWELRWLPATGSMGEQDAWLMAALDYLRRVYNELAHEAMKTPTA
jgi:hypothetical protein